MSYQSDIIAALTTDSGVSGIIGDRVFADVADGSTVTPYLVYQVISTGGETTHDGNRNLDFPSVQFSAWADTKAAAIALASAVNAALDGQTIDGESNLSLTFSDQHGTHDSESNLYGEIIEFRGACNRN